MIVTNIVVQFFGVAGNYHMKSRGRLAKELLISLLFILPMVDAYRISKNLEDDDTTFSQLAGERVTTYQFLRSLQNRRKRS